MYGVLLKFYFNCNFFFGELLGDGIDLPYQVDIANCTIKPCQFSRGKDASVQIDFFARM